jgi:sulfite reductase alpha subunit-like flavoprotein
MNSNTTTTGSNNSMSPSTSGSSCTTRTTTTTTKTTAAAVTTLPETMPILILYGSQTGNAEQAARDFQQQCRQQLSQQIQTLLQEQQEQREQQEQQQEQLVDSNKNKNTSKTTTVTTTTTTIVDTDSPSNNWIHELEPICMSLDDFLEVRYGRWTRMVVIFVSSYGVGGPPLGCYRFRELCDYWLQHPPPPPPQLQLHPLQPAGTKDAKDDNGPATTTTTTGTTSNLQLLSGIHYAICGLGDSKYTTYFQNPTVIDTALRHVGAQRIGPLGQADAAGGIHHPTRKKEQGTVIQEWIQDIWLPMAQVMMTQQQQSSSSSSEVLSSNDDDDVRLGILHDEMIRICREINPDFVVPPSARNDPSSRSRTTTTTVPPRLRLVLVLLLSIGMVLLAIVAQRRWQ